MLLSPDGRRVLSHAGWADEYRWLWSYDVEAGREERLHEFTNGFRMRSSADGRHLLIVESLEDQSHRCTVRSVDRPLDVLATAVHREERWSFDGEADLLSSVPRYVHVWANDRDQLLHIDPDDAQLDPLTWYNEGSYDLGYQGLLEPYEVPGSELLVVCVQRDSHPVLYDPATRTVRDRLSLADRGGNPSVHFRTASREVWIDDYDTLVRLRTGTWEVLDSVRLQHTSEERVRLFIGGFWFPLDERVCVVARPFSGDVLLIDPTSFETIGSVHLGEQPVDAVLCADGTLVARDWKSRRVLRSRWDGPPAL
ncbi:MAG: hypothetical protein U0V73_14785 [Acidimicrobiia bacterium]